jgi:hypothetical protein
MTDLHLGGREHLDGAGGSGRSLSDEVPFLKLKKKFLQIFKKKKKQNKEPAILLFSHQPKDGNNLVGAKKVLHHIGAFSLWNFDWK